MCARQSLPREVRDGAPEVSTLVRSALAMLLLVAVANLACAQSKADLEKGTKELETLKKQFTDEKTKAQKRVVARFDSLIASVSKAPGLSGAQRVSLAKKLAEEKEQFLHSDEIPAKAELAELGFHYGAHVNNKYRLVTQKYDMLMKLALNLKDAKAAEELLADKQQFEAAHFPGKRQFTQGSVWEGTRYDGNSSMLFRLRITELNDEVFKGRVAQDYQVAGHAIFEVDGSVDGLQIGCRSNAVVQGKARALQFRGFMLGGTMVLSISGLNPKGKPVNAFAILTRK